MPKLHFKNQATTILAEEIGANDEVLTIRGADLSLFPKDEAFLINITDQKNPADYEIILVKAVNGSTWNISRGWEGTQPQEWQEGVLISLNNSAFIINNSSQFGMPPEWHERYAVEVGYPLRAIVSSKVDGIYWINIEEANNNDPETGNGWEKIDLNVILAESHNSVPYYPKRLVAPPLSGNLKPMLNDPQPEAENATEKGLKGRYWYLYTNNIDRPVTSWFEFQDDPTNQRGYKDNGVKISGEDRNLSIMTGSAVEVPAGGYGNFKEGECLYFLSCQDESGSQGIELWTAPDADTKPVLKTLIFSYTQSANRDPMVRLSADGTKYRMARTTAEGIAWAVSTDLENWTDKGVSPIKGFGGLQECCDFNEADGYIIFGNYIQGDNNTPPTSRTIYSFGTWQNDVFVSEPQAQDVRNNCLDLGPDYYAARGTKGDLLGWCHSPETEILMSNGSIKKIKDIEIGEYVCGIDGKPRKVLELFDGETEMMEIIFYNEDKIICTENHTLVFDRTNGAKEDSRYIGGRFSKYVDLHTGLSYISAKELLSISNCFKAYHNPVRAAFLGEKKDLSIDPYYLGLWLGDGYTKEPRYIATKEKEIFQYVEKLAKKLCIGFSYSGKNTALRGEKSKNFKDIFLKEIGKDLKEIPEKYLTSSREDRLLLLAGLLDTDGCLEKTKTGELFSFCQHSDRKNLFEQVKRLARGLGFFVKQKKDRKENLFSLYISGKITEIPTKIIRKKAKRDSFSHKDSYEIKKIGLGKFNGIKVDGDSLYILANGLVTHNCNNWTYAKQLTIPNFNGFIGTPRKITPSVAPDGTKILYTKPIERNWEYTESINGISVKGSYSPIPFKFMPPSYELNISLKCNSGTWPQSIKLIFGNGSSKNYTVSIAPQGNTQEIAAGRDGKPCVEVTKDTYGSWPYGDLGQWNNYFRALLADGAPVNIKIIVDRSSAEVFINGQYALTMLVLWGDGAPEFYVKCSEGTDWKGTVKTVAPDGSLIPVADVVGDFELKFDEMPSYVDSSLDYRQVIGLPELFNPWNISTYKPDNDPNTGKETGKPFYQMTWLDVGPLVPDPKDPTGKTMVAGPPGVYLKYTYDPAEIPTPVVPLSVIAPDGEAAAILKLTKQVSDLTILVNKLANEKQQGAGALALKMASLQNGGIYG